MIPDDSIQHRSIKRDYHLDLGLSKRKPKPRNNALETRLEPFIFLHVLHGKSSYRVVIRRKGFNFNHFYSTIELARASRDKQLSSHPPTSKGYRSKPL